MTAALVGVTLAAAIAYAFIPLIAVLVAAALTLALSIALLHQKFPNETKQAAGRLLSQVSWLGKSVEREAIRQDIEGTLSAGLVAISDLSPGVAAPRVSVKFIKHGEQVDELPDGTLLISVAHHENRARNLVLVAWAYARAGVVRSARPYLDPDISQGIDFVATKSILAKADSAAIREFIESIWAPACIGRDRLRDLTAKLETLDQDGLFGPVLLEEFADLAANLANRLPSNDVAQETADFVDHLYALSQRRPGTQDETHFDGSRIKAAFVLVASHEAVNKEGAAPYIRAVEWAIGRYYPRIYLVARGAYCSVADAVALHYRGDKRVLESKTTDGLTTATRGEPIRRLSVRLRIDVRKYVGIGQAPIQAVARTFEQAADTTRQARGQAPRR